MNEFTQGILTALIPALIVSIITAYITVKLSVRQFYSERWWEKKAEAYSHIIEELSCLQYCFWERGWAKFEGIEFSEPRKTKLQEEYNRAEESIRKAAAIGAYIVSDETATALEKVLRELLEEEPINSSEQLHKCLSSVNTCIAKIRQYAKVDLMRKQ